MDIKELERMSEMHELGELFATIWGRPGEPPIDSSTLQALSHSGNYVVGAYSGKRMVGGLIGWLGGHPPDDLHLHSHILGVVPDTETRGVGFELKQHQRMWCLDRGVPSIEWTFDPLVRRNAYFNLAKLGADAVEYLVDFYGPMDDGINTGDESDRLLVRWTLDSPTVVHKARGRVELAWPVRADEALGVTPSGEPHVVRVAGPFVVVWVPEDIVAIRQTNAALARRWRFAVRYVLGEAMTSGYRVAGATRDGRYLLTRR